MTNEKININLQNVSQTLLMPLLGRALFSQEPYSPLHDKQAVELANSINYDFEKLYKKVKKSTLFWMARPYHFDTAIKLYLEKNPRGIVVNLGAGLETAFHRVDNGDLTWIDLDLPEVISLREKLLPLTDRNHNIAKSILDYTWMDDIEKLGKEFFFLAGGFFMYFTESQVKSIFIEMAKRFSRSELIFDSLSSKKIYHSNKMLRNAKMTNALLQWGLDNPNTLESWSPHIKIMSQIPYFYKIKAMPGFPFGLRAKMFFYDFFNNYRITHLKFC